MQPAYLCKNHKQQHDRSRPQCSVLRNQTTRRWSANITAIGTACSSSLSILKTSALQTQDSITATRTSGTMRSTKVGRMSAAALGRALDCLVCCHACAHYTASHVDQKPIVRITAASLPVLLAVQRLVIYFLRCSDLLDSFDSANTSVHLAALMLPNHMTSLRGEKRGDVLVAI